MYYLISLLDQLDLLKNKSPYFLETYFQQVIDLISTESGFRMNNESPPSIHATYYAFQIIVMTIGSYFFFIDL